VQDLLSGQIDVLFGPPDNLPLVRSGSIKAYAITGDKRMMIAPDIPTFGEIVWAFRAQGHVEGRYRHPKWGGC
jgi:tripartite-type tricarboxylate transporter receptor subunit TctC